MSPDKAQRWINVVIAVFVLFIVGAVIGDVLSPPSKTARIIGLVSFGALCIFLRALPRKFFIPNPKK